MNAHFIDIYKQWSLTSNKEIYEGRSLVGGRLLIESHYPLLDPFIRVAVYFCKYFYILKLKRFIVKNSECA